MVFVQSVAWLHLLPLIRCPVGAALLRCQLEHSRHSCRRTKQFSRREARKHVARPGLATHVQACLGSLGTALAIRELRGIQSRMVPKPMVGRSSTLAPVATQLNEDDLFACVVHGSHCSMPCLQVYRGGHARRKICRQSNKRAANRRHSENIQRSDRRLRGARIGCPTRNCTRGLAGMAGRCSCRCGTSRSKSCAASG